MVIDCEGAWGTFGGDESVQHLDLGGGYSSMSRGENSSSCTPKIYALFCTLITTQ